MLTTTNYGLKKPEGTDVVDVQNFNDNADIIDTKLKELYNSVSDLTYQTAGGTATAITLSLPTLINGYSKTFIASVNNSGAATTINGKPLYKPGTTAAPNLIAGKAYTVWYDSGKSCFFIKASAEGDAVAANVLAGKKFSNDNDTGLVGTLDLSNLVSGNLRSGVTINGVTGKSSVVDTADANAAAGQILNGQTSYVNGSKITGTMTNRANTKFQICGYEGITECIPHPSDPGNQGLVTGQNVYGANGYIDGNSQIQMSVAGLVPGNIKAGVNVGKNSGTGSSVMTGTFTSDATASAGQILNGQIAYVNGNKVTGTMPNRGTYQYTGGIGSAYDGNTGSSYLAFNNIPWGYYQSNNDGWSPEIRAKFADVANAIGLTSNKLVSGQNVLGVNGSATIESLGGRQSASGIIFVSSRQFTINLNFTPTFVLVSYQYGYKVYVKNNGFSGIPTGVYTSEEFSGNLYQDPYIAIGTNSFTQSNVSIGVSNGFNMQWLAIG